MTSNTSTTEEGWISFFDRDRSIGTIQLFGRNEQVYFHVAACRVVEGPFTAPVLTNRRDRREPQWFKGTPDAERVVVRVSQGSTGLIARAWGFIPQRTWLEDLAYYDVLDNTYRGGELTILYRGMLVEEGVTRIVRGRLLSAPELTPGDPWTLRLVYDVYDDLLGYYDPPTSREVTTFQLGQAHPSEYLPYGRYALDVRVGAEWAHIVLYPGSDWNHLR
jgi:hypothetical protein